MTVTRDVFPDDWLNSKTKDFSIIIPAKNEQANIGICLDSVNQVHWDKNRFEVLVVDNGSTDMTVEIARAKGAVVYVKPDFTISALRNFGASRSSGEWLVFLDADCTVGVEWLEEASRYLGAAGVVCFGSPPQVPERATWVQKAWFQARRKKEPVGKTEWLESMNMFVHHKTFACCGGFNESLVTCEDFDLCVRLNGVGTIMNDSRIVAVHHGEATTIYHFFRKERWRGVSNLAGFRQHGTTVRELPSVLAPLLHCALPVLLLVGVLLLPAGIGYLLALILLWQVTILARSVKSQAPKFNLIRTMQLYLLINVYLFARGVSIFSGGTR